MILIGSRSLALRAGSILGRAPLDFDWVCTREEFDTWLEKNSHKVKPTKVYELPQFHKMIVEGSTNCEFEIITTGTSSELLADLVDNDPETIDTPFGKVPSLNILLAIKDSHKYKKFETPRGCANFYKHAIDWSDWRDLRAGKVVARLPDNSLIVQWDEDEDYLSRVVDEELFHELEAKAFFAIKKAEHSKLNAEFEAVREDIYAKINVAASAMKEARDMCKRVNKDFRDLGKQCQVLVDTFNECGWTTSSLKC